MNRQPPHLSAADGTDVPPSDDAVGDEVGATADEVGTEVDHDDERRRLDVSSLRDLVLRAGVDVLERDGLLLAAQSIGYAQVFAHLEERTGIRVTRASVHERIWASHADFRRDALATAITKLNSVAIGSRAAEVREFVLDAWARDLSASERVAAFSRRWAPEAVGQLLADPGFGRVQGVKAVASPFNDPLTADELRGRVREHADRGRAVLRNRLAVLTAALGLAPDPALGLDEKQAHDLLATMVVNVGVGTYLDVVSGSTEMVDPLNFDGVPSDADRPWTMVGVALRAVLEALFVSVDGPVEVDAGVPPPQPGASEVPILAPASDTAARRSREELRDLVLAAGADILLTGNLDLEPESLSYASVFSHVKERDDITVFRSSVHNRIWKNNNEFWREVLEVAIHTDPDVSKPAVDAVLAFQPATDGDGLVLTRQSAMDLIRVVTEAETGATRSSPAFLRRQSIKAALGADDESASLADLRRAIHTTQLARIECHEAAIDAHVLSLGFDVRPELGIDRAEALRILVTIALAAAGGAIFDQTAGVEAVTDGFPIRRTDDPDRADRWPPSSFATWAVFDHLFTEAGG